MLFNLILAVFVVSCRGQSDEASGEVQPTQTSGEVLPTLPPVNPSVPQPPRQCAEAGLICATCDTVSLCIVNGEGMINTINQTCRPDEQCVAGQCVKGALCNYKPFQCSEEGFFPDPYDCKKYHVCLPIAVDGNDDLMTFECPEGTSYDALSASCGFPLTTDACINRPVPECTQRLQVGALLNNRNIYYTCVENEGRLAPELRKCPGGGKFKADKLTCKAETSEKSTDKKGKKSKE